MNRTPRASNKTLSGYGYAPVNGLTMYYEVHGSGNGVPVVTIHPFAGVANVFPELARNRRLVAVELQGHGRTPDIDRPLTFEQEADDVGALIEHLDLGPVDVFGESFGGIPSMLLAIRHPRLVRKVATYASPLGDRRKYARPESASVFAELTPEHESVRFQKEAYEGVSPDPGLWPVLFRKARGFRGPVWVRTS